MLKGLVDSGEIKARSKWKVVYPLFKEDPRYLDMLGNPGSNPLELFWDVVDSLDRALDSKILVVEEAIRKWNEKHVPAESRSQPESVKDGEDAKVKEEEAEGSERKEKDSGPKKFQITPETSKTELLDILKEDGEVLSKLSTDDLEEIFQTVCLAFSLVYLEQPKFTTGVSRSAMKQSSVKQTRNVGLNVVNVISKMIYATRSRSCPNPSI